VLVSYRGRQNLPEDSGRAIIVDNDGFNRTRSFVGIIGPGAVTEGDSGTHDAVFTVGRFGALDAPASVDFYTLDRGGFGGEPANNFVPVRTTVNFAPGESSATVAVPVIGDGLLEGPKHIFTALDNPSGVTVLTPGAVADITDDDLSFIFIDSPVAHEGNPDAPQHLVYTLTRVGSLAGEAKVTFDNDVVTFAPGQRTAQWAVPISPDTRSEEPEKLQYIIPAIHISNAQTGFSIARAYIIDDDPRPMVTGVFVNGTSWDQAFRDALSGSVGYAVPGGPGQSRALPWAGIDQISISFSQDVSVDADDLLVIGTAVPGPYPFADDGGVVPAFAYDPLTHIATWTLKDSLGGDAILLDLNGDSGSPVVASDGGARLDGQWLNGADAYPSGGSPLGGADFRFDLNVLPGDATGDGAVDALDLADVKRRLNRTAASPGSGPAAYSIFADINPDTRINALDLSAVKQRLNRRLPVVQPVAVIDGPGLFRQDPRVDASEDLRALLK